MDKIGRISLKISLALAFSLALLKQISAEQAGGLTLLESAAARSSALGQAFTSATDDVAVIGYNPALLTSLKTSQAAFLYHKGTFEDTYGQLQIGGARGKTAAGLSFGYYDAGDVELDNGPVSAQRDMLASLAFSRKGGHFSVGVTGKYLSSELIETYRAQAFAADLGLAFTAGSRLQLGAAAQNLGTELKFVEEGDPLPRLYRAGFSLRVGPGANASALYVDNTYRAIEGENIPAAGVEFVVGPLALRGGARFRSGNTELTAGTGFIFGKTSLDYAFAMSQNLDAQHLVSFNLRFGSGSPRLSSVVRDDITHKEKQAAPTRQTVSKVDTSSKKNPITEMTPYRLSGQVEKITVSAPQSSKRDVYEVKEGDTLARIARKQYGRSELWQRIYSANKHLIDDPAKLSKGMKIIIP